MFFVFFAQICPNGETSVHDSDLKNALDMAGYRLPNHKVRTSKISITSASPNDKIQKLYFQVRDLLLELKSEGKVGDDQMVSKEIFKEVILCSF